MQYRGEGRIELILGCMFSGKSTELLRRTQRHSIARRRCLAIKFAKDTRYSMDAIATHDQKTMEAVSVSTLAEVGDAWQGYDVISIDEGQFFPDIVEFAEEVAAAGKIVLVCGLDGDFRRAPFGRLLELIPRAESVVKLTAVCKSCGADAVFSRRLSKEQEVEVIGGADKYIPVCRRCYHRDGNEVLACLSPAPTHRSAASSRGSVSPLSQEAEEAEEAEQAGQRPRAGDCATPVKAPGSAFKTTPGVATPAAGASGSRAAGGADGREPLALSPTRHPIAGLQQ